MDKSLWMERFVARMRKDGVMDVAPSLTSLAADAYDLGSHMSPETVARIEADLANHRARVLPAAPTPARGSGHEGRVQIAQASSDLRGSWRLGRSPRDWL